MKAPTDNEQPDSDTLVQETIPVSIADYGSTSSTAEDIAEDAPSQSQGGARKIRRRPSYLYRIADEESPLMGGREETTAESRDQVVKFAIYMNLTANFVLLVAKLIVTIMTSSLSVVASLVDGVMDMLSSVIIFITSRLIERKNHLTYPVGRSRLEPLGVLVFSVIMITSFVQVFQEGCIRLFSGEHKVVKLGPWAIAIMLTTVVVKGACWLWCRLVKNSSVQALAADALTDVVFNTFSILFPLGKSSTSTQETFANCTSWSLSQHLVARSSRRYPPLGICHCPVVSHLCRTHPQPHRRSCLSRANQHFALSRHALRQSHQANHIYTCISRRRPSPR